VANLAAIVAGFQARRGFVGFVIAAVLGALGVLGHAPFHVWPAYAVSICGFLLLMDGAAARPKPMLAGFGVAWSWAFGYFLAGMFWVGNAFLVDADKFAMLMPFAVTALPAGLAIFTGLGGALAARFWRGDATRLIIFAVAISLSEFARGHLLTGLPWNLPAYIWRPGDVISQTAALIGPYGLTLLTLFVLASPVAVLSASSKSYRRAIVGSAIAISLAVIAFGVIRLNAAGPINAMAGKGPLISAGQGGFSQKEVWDPANATRVGQTYLDLLANPDALKSDIVIWPEATFPFLALEQPDLLAAIQERLGDRTLVFGSIRRTPSSQGDVYANSLLIFDNGDTAERRSLSLRGAYDKYHLVPFGEYLPFRPIFKAFGIASLVAYDGEMTPGPRPSTIALRGAPLIDPRICYEAVFPSFNPKAASNAGWILNISIDAWFGDRLGPDQFYAQARARAIETGMPMVRAASGGWSAIVDRYGRPLAEHRDGAGYAIARLPLDVATTTYGRVGNNTFLYLLICSIVVIIITRKKILTSSQQ
jgi:apolipoprotein N-acyltransferase